ncbi:hypothetical protein A3J23_02715 [Candidatus Peregrinibacteria bacterium RIFCSPLOWO2_02_FULL_48_14]|nr:MAG: hypothetical protein A3J23_02715 [Candidatus Peregrinibacteria bacterium RIFCSPLOWO2_02_FULL_48_14]
MNFDEAYAKLSPEQKTAVDHLDGPMMVLAGPGTGKTQIIALRIAQILKQTQMAPHNILCLTFTDSGVMAMRSRLLEMIGSTAYRVRIHTFHSFCNEIIQENPETFLFARDLEPLTDLERIQLFREILESSAQPNSPLVPFFDPYYYLHSVRKAIQDLKRENIDPATFEQALSTIEKTLTLHGETLESFTATRATSLKENDFEELQTKLAGTVFSVPFLQYDFTDKKERTALKSALKNLHQELKNQAPKQRDLLLIFTAYQKELQKRGRYDYEDMVLFVVRKFQEDETLLARYQEQFQYILVDEYQDTNNAQNEVLRLLATYFENPNVFVVGDDKQSIFRFQGASLENMLSFYSLYKKSMELVSLKDNYRSQQTVLDAADSLIRHAANSLIKQIPELHGTLTSSVPFSPEPLRLAEFENPRTELYFVAKEIQKLLAENTKPSEIAIIYRNHRDAHELTELLLRMSIPFRVLAGHDILKDKTISKLIGLLECLTKLDDDHHLFTTLNADFLGFSSLDLAKLSIAAHKARQGLFETMLDSEIFRSFAEKLSSWSTLSMNLPLAEFFDRLIKESGFLDFILAKENKIEHLNRLNTLFDELKKHNYANPQMSLKDFLEMLELLKENDLTLPEHELATTAQSAALPSGAVRLLTAHKSKGLEFEHVFIINFIDKHWGNITQRDKLKLPPNLLKIPLTSERNEDERRLFYVALTRAKKSVTLSYPKANEKNRPVMPSEFLSEIAPEFLQKLDTLPIENDAFNHLSTLFFQIPKTTDEQEKIFLKSMLENYTLSVTSLNNYLRCPRLFYYNNLLRVPRAKTHHEAYGTAVHEALKDWLLEAAPTKEFLIAQFEHHLRREILSKQEFRGGLELGQKTLADYYDHYSTIQNTNVLVEYDFKSHGVTLDGIPLTGKLDKIEILDPTAKTVHVVDYKTGNPDSKAKELAEGGAYRRQIAFYQLLCKESKKFPYLMVSGEIDFVQPGKKSSAFIKKAFTISETELDALRTQIRSVYEDIQNLRFLNPNEFETCGECEWCGNGGR